MDSLILSARIEGVTFDAILLNYQALMKDAQKELHEIRSAIAGLQKGELIIKDQTAFALGMGSKYKKINVTHLI